MTSRAKAVVSVLVCVALWALIPVVAKLGQTELDSHQFLFWSSIVSFVALAGASVVTGKARLFRTYRLQDWCSAVGLGFLGTYLYYILLYFGYAKARGLEVLVLQYGWPIFVVLFSLIILRERLTLRRSGAMVLGFLGVALVLTKGHFTQIHLDNVGVNLLVMVAALVFGLFSVLSKRIRLEPYGLITVYFLTATVASFGSMLLFSDLAPPTRRAVWPILLNGVFVNGFSYVFWLKALKEAEASFVAPFVFLTPVLSALYLIVFFHEPVLPVYVLGLIAVIAGGLLNTE